MVDPIEIGASRFLFNYFNALYDTIFKIFSLNLVDQLPLGEPTLKDVYSTVLSLLPKKHAIFGHFGQHF